MCFAQFSFGLSVSHATVVWCSTSLEDVDTWEFDVLAHPPHLARAYAAKIFMHFDLLKRFNIRMHTLNAFLEAVQTGYHEKNQYHNFYHVSTARL